MTLNPKDAATALTLQKREVKGLRMMLATTFVFILLFIPGLFFLTPSSIELQFTLVFIVISSILVVILYFLAHDPSRKHLVGYSFVILSLLVMNILPWIWYYSYGGSILPLGYFIKTNFLSLSLIFIALVGIALNPRYPLLLSLGILGTWIWYILQAAFDPKTEWTSDYVKGVFGPSVDINILVWETIGLIAVGILTTLITSLARNAVKEAVSLEASNSQLSRYFSPNIVTELQNQGADFTRLGGKTQDVAVLFADIRDFTTLTEKMTPNDVLQLLSVYHDAMTTAIFANGGTLDKFIGDGIMATFGTPLTSKDDPVRAVRTGFEMLKRLEALNLQRKAKNQESLRIGIGIHFGSVLVGNIGTSQRLEYTVLGDTVNVASRIEGFCKETGHSFLISTEVKNHLPPTFDFISVGFKMVKGRSEGVEIWSPFL